MTLLQAMRKKVGAEVEKEKELYEKFMWYCKTNNGALEAGISAANTTIPAVSSSVKVSEEQKASLEEELKQAQINHSSAKAVMSEATSPREEEVAAIAD